MYSKTLFTFTFSLAGFGIHKPMQFLLHLISEGFIAMHCIAPLTTMHTADSALI